MLHLPNYQIPCCTKTQFSCSEGLAVPSDTGMCSALHLVASECTAASFHWAHRGAEYWGKQVRAKRSFKEINRHSEAVDCWPHQIRTVHWLQRWTVNAGKTDALICCTVLLEQGVWVYKLDFFQPARYLTSSSIWGNQLFPFFWQIYVMALLPHRLGSQFILPVISHFWENL